MTKWTYDEPISDFSDKPTPLAAIYITSPEDGSEVRTIDLMGAHVLLDVDADGNVVSVEIIGPAVFIDLKNLGEYLMEPDSELKAAADDLTRLSEELGLNE